MKAILTIIFKVFWSVSKMIYDFYATFQIERKEPTKGKKEINDLTGCSGKYSEITDVLSRIMLLTTAYAIKGKIPDRKNRPNRIAPDVYAKVGERDRSAGLKALIHLNGAYNIYLQCKLSKLSDLGINSPIDSSPLPKGSWILEFPITLSSPFMSKGDISFYIIENPVRKSKIFGIPFTSAMAWKGNLRWAMMKVSLEPAANCPNKYARIRFRHMLLFGTEKGWKEEKSWNDYLNKLCSNAKERYENMIKKKFNKTNVKDVHVQGMLHFYPTFWDKMDMIVINPQDRKTKTGRNPIYFEVVPAGAKGIFRLVYIPFYWFGCSKEDLKRRIIEDLRDVVAGVKGMMKIYGFSAKKSSGFGMIEDKWDRDESWLEIKGFYDVQRFGNFEELKEIVEKWGDKGE